MKGGNHCLFRYYEILPLDLEPEYKLGYTCDMCSRDFSEAPFFHCAQTGRDLCIGCGGRLGLNPFSALVSTVMTPNVIWRDTQKEAIVVLCYQVQFEYFGCYFSDGSNLLIACGEKLSSIYIEADSRVEKYTSLLESELLRRFPWAKDAFRRKEDGCICFYPLAKSPDYTRPCFLTSFRQDRFFIEFRFSDGFSEILHSEEGVVLVVRESFVLSCLVNNSPLRWGKSLPKPAASALEWFLNSD